MEPKLKAVQIIMKMQFQKEPLSFAQGKKCALVAIDEMLDFRNSLYINEDSLAQKYLLEVKKEIEKL
jgi:hypothetical protein